MSKERISIRLSDRQMLILTELKEKLHCSYSVMIRSFVGDFITRNEDALERIITGEKEIDPNWLNNGDKDYEEDA